jgi:ribosome biogenesis GTPase
MGATHIPSEASLDQVTTHPGAVTGRVVRQSGPVLVVETERGSTFPARVGGALAHQAATASDLPVVGDQVVVVPGVGGGDGLVVAVLPRRSLVRRRAAGSETDAQPLAANVDVVVLVVGLDPSFSLRRIERAAVLAWESGAQPVIVLTKADLCPDLDGAIHQVQAACPGIDVVAVSAMHGEGLDDVRAALPAGATGVLLGVSGAGKSTLTNALLGAAHFDTNAMSDPRRGRHTTSHRELVQLPHGAWLVDGPGVREFGMVDHVDVEKAFPDIEALATACRFRDCTHEGEPDCAVTAAVADGVLDATRLASFLTLEREVAFARSRTDPEAARERKSAARILSKKVRQASRHKRP